MKGLASVPPLVALMSTLVDVEEETYEDFTCPTAWERCIIIPKQYA